MNLPALPAGGLGEQGPEVETPPDEITGLLSSSCEWSEKLDEILPMVFNDLRQLARYYFSREAGPGHTLQPTALISEVYLRLVGCTAPQPMNREQFFVFATRLIREILMDHARRRKAAKRGGGVPRQNLEEALGLETPDLPDPDVLLTIHQALKRLKKIAPRQCQVVELRYFTGLSLPQVAEVLAISRATAERDWSAARCWLARELVK
ncbi:MAG: sigma-70 family RNA polymerase sigma factor [Acidobacteria bacterium]|nr:sigma-70 family RNA polymerase sigma factor [Acidobacteriota bacterium]